jgi:predicted glycosyltransferase
LRALRRDVLRAAAAHFRPRVLLVDNVPGGLKRELVPTLRDLKESGCRLVLGLRDIVDEAERVRRAWSEDGSYELLDDVYDRILVYGERDIYDATLAYGFSPKAAAKTRFVGYLGREPGRWRPEEVRSSLGVDGRRLALVMAGGGGDGSRLLRTVLAGLGRGRRGFELMLLAGPFLPRDERETLVVDAREASVRYLDFVDDAASYVGAADAVVSMGGYNSVCELLSVGKPALVVPRVEPRREQLIRAELLSSRGFLRMLHPAELKPRRLSAEFDALLDAPPPPRLLLNGLPGAADALDELLEEKPEAALVAGGRRG